MKFKLALGSAEYGLCVFILLGLLSPLWIWTDLYLWIPFAAAVPLLFLHCRVAKQGAIQAGLTASLPGLVLPCLVYGMAHFMWQAVLQARAEGGLFCIMTLGDPYEASTLFHLIAIPSAFILGAGLLSGALGHFFPAKELMRLKELKASA